MPMSTTTTTPDLIQHLNDLLNEEKWTRAAINNYTVANFKELDEIVDRVSEEGLESEVRELCEDHLQHTKNSIIALYISGLLDLARQSVDDANLILLTKIFTDNHKWNLVEYLANRILEFGENRFALRILADVYNNENENDKLHEVWERLIRVDYEEADIVRHLAELREKEENTEQAIAYYKKALHRYITKKKLCQRQRGVAQAGGTCAGGNGVFLPRRDQDRPHDQYRSGGAALGRSVPSLSTSRRLGPCRRAVETRAELRSQEPLGAERDRGVL